jgi:hypothetical protein
LATNYCLQGETRSGRECYLEAIRLYPLGFKAALGWCMSFFGAGLIAASLAVNSRIRRIGRAFLGRVASSS